MAIRPLPLWFAFASVLVLPLAVVAADAPPAKSPPPSAAKAPAPFPISLSSPRAIAVDPAGNLFVADAEGGMVHRISPTGTDTLLGLTDGALPFSNPCGIALDHAGNVFVADAAGNAIFKIATDGKVTQLSKGYPGFSTPTSLVVDTAGHVFVANNGDAVILKLTGTDAVAEFAGNSENHGDLDGTGTAARFAGPRGLAIDAKDNLYVADEADSDLRKITPAGVVTTIAFQPDAKEAKSTPPLAGPRGVAVDSAGNLYVADTDNNLIRKITPAGVLTTLAGVAGSSGTEDGPGATAHFAGPRGIAVDVAGNVFVADSDNGSIRKITPDGMVTTVTASPKP